VIADIADIWNEALRAFWLVDSRLRRSLTMTG